MPGSSHQWLDIAPLPAPDRLLTVGSACRAALIHLTSLHFPVFMAVSSGMPSLPLFVATHLQNKHLNPCELGQEDYQPWAASPHVAIT